jgi:sterol desaturase/sphingolipid hydroxylase (fatty acid hydroxylase superfamily)
VINQALVSPLLASGLGLLANYSWQNAYKYFILAALAFAFLFKLKSKVRSQIVVRPLPNQVGLRQLFRELFFSVVMILICGSLAPVILILNFGRDLYFYKDIEEYGWTYFFVSIFLMMLVRDALFYWEHRLMHARKLFKRAHYIHHQSLQTTPLSAFSVHPMEAIFAAALPYALILFLVPKHPLAYLIFTWIDAAVGVVTHMGYEVFPRGFSRHWLGRWIGTATAHQIHHRYSSCNYGLYFLFWDRWMGTLDKKYDYHFDVATGMLSEKNAVIP